MSTLRNLQPLKALEPILVTLSGIVREIKSLQPLKASEPMFVTPLGTTMSLTSFPFTKRWWAMDSGFEPNVMLHHAAMSEMFTDVKPLQSEYLQLIVYQFVLIKTVDK